MVLPYLVNFGPFLTNFVHQIGEKTEKNTKTILLTCHFYVPSVFLNINVSIILSTSKKFYILPKWFEIQHNFQTHLSPLKSTYNELLAYVFKKLGSSP